ncbi:MAG TPA: CAP domain-containing protein, partial [Polyangiaceae bacterium]|nr:CAP domain-containing protein [Polyangiaceae bacterium]
SGGASSGGAGYGGAASGGAASGGQSSGGTNGTGGTSPAEPEVPDNAACAAVSDWPSARSEEEEQVLALVNQRRASGASCGGTAMPAVAPLTMDPYLRCAARLHSLDMAQRDYFSHATWNESATTCQADNGCTSGNICGSEFPDDPDDDVTPIKRCGKSPGTRVSEAGGPSGAGWENIAAGNDTAEATMTQWMNSSGHCTNIMRANLKTIGIGFATGPATYGDYWTQSFND